MNSRFNSFPDLIKSNSYSNSSKMIANSHPQHKYQQWTPAQDNILIEGLASGVNKWPSIAKLLPGKSAIQCRERWETYLEASLKEGRWSNEEDKKLVNAYIRWGECWTKVAHEIPGRSERSCSHRWKAVLLCEDMQAKALLCSWLKNRNRCPREIPL